MSATVRRASLSTVSIRAPVRGRCTLLQSGEIVETVSIRAPVRGRWIALHHRFAVEDVSIRAPVRGRCEPPQQDRNLIGGFNPRPRAGAMDNLYHLERASVFQSAPPCGGDVAVAGLLDVQEGVSIRAPVRGRCLRTMTMRAVAQFQSAPPCGGDASAPYLPTLSACFNPRPRAGAMQ